MIDTEARAKYWWPTLIMSVIRKHTKCCTVSFGILWYGAWWKYWSHAKKMYCPRCSHFLSWPQRHHGKNYTAGHQTGDCEAEKFYKLALFAYLIFVKNNNNNISTFLEYFFLLVFIILAVFDKSVESWFWFVTPLNNF